MERPNLLHLYYLDPSKHTDVVNKMNKAGFDVFFSPDEVLPENVHAILVGAHELQADDLRAYSQLEVILQNMRSAWRFRFCVATNS